MAALTGGQDPAPALAACTLPMLIVQATMPADLARVRAAAPHAWIGQTVGAGHFHQLMVPDQVNAMIARFVASVGAS